MRPFTQGKSSLDKILWMVIFIGMVISASGGSFSLGSFFLMPAPLIILNVLVSPLTAGVLIVGATVLFAAEQGVMAGVSFFLLIGVFSQFQGFMIRRMSRVSRVLFWSTVFLLGNILMLILLGSAGAALLSTLAANMKTAIQSSSYGDTFNGTDLAGFFPFLILYLIVTFSAANFFLSRWVLQFKAIPVIPLGTLSEFQLPPRVMAGTLFMIVMGYGVQTAGLPSGPVLVDTLLYLTLFVFTLQGLAVCSFFIKRQGITPAWHAAILAAILVIAGPIGLGLAGFSDVLMDLRKQRRAGGHQR